MMLRGRVRSLVAVVGAAVGLAWALSVTAPAEAVDPTVPAVTSLEEPAALDR